MSHISEQHPEFVLRSRYVQLRALFAIAAVAAVCLTAVVVVLALDDDGTSSGSAAISPAVTAPVTHDTMSVAPGTRYDGGPDEGTRGPSAFPPAADARYDGGPDEGTRGPSAASPPADDRYDGGPDEGTRGPGR